MHVGHKPQYNVCQVNIITVQSLKTAKSQACTVLEMDSQKLAVRDVIQLVQKALMDLNQTLPI